MLGAVETEPAPSGTVVRLQRAWNRVPLEAVALAAAAAVVVLVIQGRPEPEATEADAASTVAAKSEDPSSPPPLRDPAAAIEADPLRRAVVAPTPAAPTTAAEEMAVEATQPSPPKPEGRTASSKAEPYVASWEKGGAGSADAGLATTYGYRLRIASPEVLFSLSSIAETAGGEVRDSGGRVLKPRLLNREDDYEQTLLAVPLAEAEAVRGHLEALGSTSVPPPAAPRCSRLTMPSSCRVRLET